MSTIYTKIKNRRIELNLSQDELALKTGYKDRSSIAKIEKGLVDLSITKVTEFADALGVTASYLMGWEDEVEKEDIPSAIDIKDLNVVPIKHITNFVACCGNGIDFSEIEDNEEIIYLPTEIVGHDYRNTWVMHTTGDSMNKKIPENSKIIVKKKDYYSSGDIVLYKIADSFAIKEYYLYNDRIVLKPSSYNPVHEQETYNFEDRDNGFEFPSIIGKVVSFYGTVSL